MQNETKYTLISDLAEIDTVLANTSIIGLDIETGGLIAKESKLRLIQIADEHGGIYILDCFNFNLQDISNTLKPHLENKNLKIVIHNAKFEYSWINYHLGIELNSFFDTYLASLLLDFEAEAKLGPVLEAQLGIAIDKTEQKSDWLGVLSNSQLQYAANDVKYLIELRKVMLTKLTELDMLKATKLEFDIVPVVSSMELAGFPVNRQRFEEFIAKTEIERDEGKAKLSHFLMSEGGKKDYYRTYTIDLFGNEVETDNESSINIRSSKQLLEKFEAAGINIDSTNKKFVSVYAKQYPDLALLINFRDKEKLCSTYGREFVSKYVKTDDRVYPSYFQLGTVTSRFSASSPNSTNQPHSTEFRRLFAPKAGRKFCISDYAQYEMRVLANYALDSIMINAFEAGQDLHSVTTANLFNIPYEECTLPKNKEKRNTAKQINFALAYGIGPQGLALRLQGNGIDVNEDECKVLIDKWYEAYPDAGKWLKKQRYLVNNLIKKSKAGQKVCIDLRTLDNRILKVPFIVGDFSSEAGAKRNCMNWCIQNANALSTKRAMINIHKELKDKNLDAAIVNAIHDELICESSEKDAQETAEIVERCMVEAGNFYLPHVKVEAECKVVDDWSQK